MNDAELRQVILRVLGEIAPEADPERIDPKTSLRDQLDIDSMDFLNFVIALHEALDVDIPEVDYPKLSSLDGAADYLSSQRRSKA
jgi:acyl carrier protein